MATTTRRRTQRARATVVTVDAGRSTSERLVGEEPLEIRVAGPDGTVVGTTATMRTPGHDFELAAGLLRAEGVIASPDDLAEIRYCTDVDEQRYNVVTVHLRRAPRRALAARSLMATASCGVCGTASIDELCERVPAVRSTATLDSAVLHGLPETLREHQPLFARTGGSHGAGVFAADGTPLVVREDVGRHNALDKALGARFLAGAGPARDASKDERPSVGGRASGRPTHRDGPDVVAVLSGRVSFELVQKTAAAGIPILVAVSAPSSLAVETAERLGITLAAFVRDGRATLYAHPGRIAAPAG